jgi:kynureninase
LKSAPAFSEAWLKTQVWPRFARVLAREEVYLANHSLGRPPDRMAGDVQQALDAWYRDMGEAWDLWIAKRDEWRALTAKLVNAPSPDCIVPKTSAGQGLRAVLNSFMGKPRVLTSNAEFDSLDFILRVYRDQGRIDLKTQPFESFRAEPCELVVLSSVAFRTGAVFPGLEECVRKLRAQGACVLIDVYHHAGVLPLDLAALDVDFAVGGSYKYLRGGPGVCWLYVHPRHHQRRTLDTGWFAKKDMFKYERPNPPQFASGGDGWLESTPPILGPFQALAGLEVVSELGVDRLRAYNLEQKRLLAALLPHAEGADEGHGAFVTVVHPDATRLAQQLAGQNVKVDARGSYLRICPDILNSRAELERAAKLVQNLSAR